MRGLGVGQGEEPHQVSRFQLTRTDFPTLGSEKNPDLRPQHSKCGWRCIWIGGTVLDGGEERDLAE